MDMFEKLRILSDAAKYDAACTSSGVDRKPIEGGIGSSAAAGICHSFSSDGRCISLLKILMSNACSYDCVYCANRRSNNIERATFTPREIADLTISFYKRNYIEGLFLSSGVLGDPTTTTQKMIEALEILRYEHKFYGYIHAKGIPGTEKAALDRLMLLCDRISVNIELPSSSSLNKLAPDKSKNSVLEPMGFIGSRIGQTHQYLAHENVVQNRAAKEIANYNHGWRSDRFAPAGQSTQMIIGASPETDLQILRLTEALYKKYALKRVFFSAYIPINESALLPSVDSKPPLLRENRLYQADWLMRVYGFKSSEILDENNPQFNPFLDPKCNWAVNHPEFFPVEVNKADYETLLRVPGIGILGARKIIRARKSTKLNFEDLKRLNVVLKRAKYFILCEGKGFDGANLGNITANELLSKAAIERLSDVKARQISMFDDNLLTADEQKKSLTGQL